MAGLKIRPVDVNQSDWLCTLEQTDETVPELVLRLGFRYVRGFRQTAGEAIMRADVFRTGDHCLMRASNG